MQNFHYLLGCHAIGINSSLFSALRFSNLICQANSVRIIFIKIIIKINIIKIYIKNPHFIARKYIRIFIKVEYIFLCVQSSKKLFNHFTCNKPIGNKFQCCKRIINSFITHSLSFIFMKTIHY